VILLSIVDSGFLFTITILGYFAMEIQSSYFGSLLNMNEFVGVPMGVPLSGDHSNVVNSGLGSPGLEKPVSAFEESTDVAVEVVVPKVMGTIAKSFSQVLSKTCVIVPHYQFSRSILKGDDMAIKIPENEYKFNLESCKNHLHGRLILSKGDPPRNFKTCVRN